MKTFGKRYLGVYLIVHLLFLVLAVIVFRRAEVSYPFVRLEIGALLISVILTASISLFRMEKGNSVVNTILGYLVIIPAIFLLRTVFGAYLFRFSWLIYIAMVLVGIIYGIAVWVVSLKYKKEVQDLNQMLQAKEAVLEEPKDS